uniref:Uncharacterized protein n=1 Tax=Rhodopseudomonas palustris (strain ATCC BAA-98 / CGA009) TaxID=258594 RepID=Q6N222_RHOPA|nr:hypothetical protein RPA4228 [Rhodopseudomonas palustris CGA009]
MPSVFGFLVRLGLGGSRPLLGDLSVTGQRSPQLRFRLGLARSDLLGELIGRFVLQGSEFFDAQGVGIDLGPGILSYFGRRATEYRFSPQPTVQFIHHAACLRRFSIDAPDQRFQ